MVRYEELSVSPFNITQDVFQFYGLSFDKHVKDYLYTHTDVNQTKSQQEINIRTNRVRNSKSTPFHWIKELHFDEVEKIQENCKEAMRVWGYKMVHDINELQHNFSPVLPLHI